MYEERIYVGCGLDDDSLKKALCNQRTKDTVVYPMNAVARGILSATKDIRVEVGNVVVDKVHIEAECNSVQIEFTVSWSIYHGCKDQDESDDEIMSETATYTPDGFLIFQVPEARRPRNDC